MRNWLVALIVLVLLAGGIAAGYKPAMEAWELRSAPKWKVAEVVQGDIVSVVNATGTIKPVTQVAVGSFVSGPIDPKYQLRDRHGNLMWMKGTEPSDAGESDGDGPAPVPKYIAQFNDEVKEGDMLAKVDPIIYQANLDRDMANLKSREADRDRVEALVKQARRDVGRVNALLKEEKEYNEQLKKQNKDPTAFIAQGDVDKVVYGQESLEAQLELAAAAVDQARAQLAFSEAQLRYTNIVAPVDGIIIQRKIDPGQTVAAQFQTPELFVIGPEMREHMYVHASVDEADIGLIHEAHRKVLPVSFTVDAYPELFKGWIEEIRLSSTTTQNVVTYPVVVETGPNPDLKLLPGMTANISFEVDSRTDVIKIPNSALRFFPQPQYVRPEDKALLEGKQTENEEQEASESVLSANDRATARKNRNRRHVWVQERSKLRAVEVHTGLSDSRYTELVSGELKEGDKLVIGIQPAVGAFGQ